MTWMMKSVLAVILIFARGKAQTFGNNFTIDLGPSGKEVEVRTIKRAGEMACTDRAETWPVQFAPLPVVPSSTLPPPSCTHSFVPLDGSCYKGIKVSATWPEALAYCEVFGAELAIIKSQQEQTAVEGYLKTLRDPEYGSDSHHQYWFGANDIVTEGDWKWAVTMKTINYTNWRPGNPDNGGDDKHYDEEHCAEMSEEHSWQWNDNGCEEEKHFLCEMM